MISGEVLITQQRYWLAQRATTETTKERIVQQHPMTDDQAARYIARTHPLRRQQDEEPEDFVLRIVRSYDAAKRLTDTLSSIGK